MKYKILYSVVCNTGKVRLVNQDNFWCMGKYLEEKNKGLDEIVRGVATYEDMPVLGIFDGMGGEKHGETAAYIAAHTFDVVKNELLGNDLHTELNEVFLKMNDAVCDYKELNDVTNMGTTGAVICFDKDKVYVANVGDSRIYGLHRKKFTQLSIDHCLEIQGLKKAPLTQYIGVFRTEFIIEPYIAEYKICNKDRFIICSDGLTDMVSEDEIKDILIKGETVDNCSEQLLKRALENGGRDNVTIIVCEVGKLGLFEKCKVN